MAVSVVDASALGALLFGEPAAEAVAARLADGNLAAPDLLPYELGNICWKKCRQHPGSAARLREAFRLLPAMDLKLYGLDPDAVLDTALALDLTFYDAGYVWLARQLRAPLVTLDRRLAALEG